MPCTGVAIWTTRDRLNALFAVVLLIQVRRRSAETNSQLFWMTAKWISLCVAALAAVAIQPAETNTLPICYPPGECEMQDCTARRLCVVVALLVVTMAHGGDVCACVMKSVIRLMTHVCWTLPTRLHVETAVVQTPTLGHAGLAIGSCNTFAISSQFLVKFLTSQFEHHKDSMCSERCRFILYSRPSAALLCFCATQRRN